MADGHLGLFGPVENVADEGVNAAGDRGGNSNGLLLRYMSPGVCGTTPAMDNGAGLLRGSVGAVYEAAEAMLDVEKAFL